MRNTSTISAIMPAAKTHWANEKGSNASIPERKRASHPNRKTQPCQLVGGPQPKPEFLLAGNQYLSISWRLLFDISRYRALL